MLWQMVNFTIVEDDNWQMTFIKYNKIKLT
jgi:hypothetical protein